ncbi:MAG: TrkH family potassium uptake protein [Spirochaetia bacterium]
MTRLKAELAPQKTSLKINLLVLITLLLSIVSLIVEQADIQTRFSFIFTNTLDFTILFLFLTEVIVDFLRSSDKRHFLKNHVFGVLFLFFFAALFAYNKYLLFSSYGAVYGNLPGKIIIVRSIFVLLKVFARIRKLKFFLRSLTAHPARTVMLSFVLVIVTGMVLLMLPFMTLEGSGLGFVDSLFTATSAVCVTGLIVVDTATAFSIWGKIIILLLVQVGGLGIMILSFFMAFILRRSLTLEDKFLISYMISEKDMSNLGKSIKNIINITLIIEGVGAVLLFLGFRNQLGTNVETVFISVFHAVSAFCNAGFSLFSDSLEGFRSNTLVNLTVTALIICGGLSFMVIMNLKGWLAGGVSNLFKKKSFSVKGLSLNTRVVLLGTVVLLGLGMLLIYALEHRHSFAALDLKTQYLTAFFQSVTTRTAGFNTISISGLREPTYLLMMIFMFIGGASGSTAGGVKINSLALFLAYVSSLLKDKREVTLFNHSVAKDLVLRALLILLFGLVSVLGGMLILSITERASFIQICFETVSAFGTVGLSTGITSTLSIIGKYVIILLMFIGRIGPLTLLAAAVQRMRKVQIEYPTGEILVG